jgi:hypothetical protein
VGLLGLVPLLYAIWRVARWSFGQLMNRADVSAGVLIAPLILHASVSLGFAGWVTNSVLLFLFLAARSDFKTSEPTVDPSTDASLVARTPLQFDTSRGFVTKSGPA